MQTNIHNRTNGARAACLTAAALLLALGALFWPSSLDRRAVLFSNDGPYGGLVAQVNAMPESTYGQWNDLNWLGHPSVVPGPSVSWGLRALLWGLPDWSAPLLLLGAVAACLWGAFTRRPLRDVALKSVGALCYGTIVLVLAAVWAHEAGWEAVPELDTVLSAAGLVFVASLLAVFVLREGEL